MPPYLDTPEFSEADPRQLLAERIEDLSNDVASLRDAVVCRDGTLRSLDAADLAMADDLLTAMASLRRRLAWVLSVDLSVDAPLLFDLSEREARQ